MNPGNCKYFPLHTKFDDKSAIDREGVYCDTLPGFWEETYRHLFDGGCLLTPMLHPKMDMTGFPTVSKNNFSWIFFFAVANSTTYLILLLLATQWFRRYMMMHTLNHF